MRKPRFLWVQLLCFALILLPLAASAYDYPVSNRYIATIAGTPKEYKATLPVKIPEKQMELKVIEGRQVPPVFWFQNSLKYSLSRQEHRAPLMFIIAAAGSSYNSSTMAVLQKAFYQAGFHVVCLTSPTHPNFIVTASSSGVPGNMRGDAKDLYRVMTLVREQIKEKVEVSDYCLTGYSLGGAVAAFIARLDDEERKFNFRKVLMIDPPVSLYSSIRIIDAMLARNVPGGMHHLNAFIDGVMTRFAGLYQGVDTLDFNNDVLYQVFEEKKTSDAEMAALIGISFRLMSSNMIFTVDVLNNLGYIVPRNRVISMSDSTTEYLKVALRISFERYFDEVYLPFFQARTPGLTKEELIAGNSLRSLESYLAGNGKIGLMVNEDDFILAAGELDYLRRTFGSRARVYPHGGHLGNIEYRENIADMVGFFTGGWQ